MINVFIDDRGRTRYSKPLQISSVFDRTSSGIVFKSNDQGDKLVQLWIGTSFEQWFTANIKGDWIAIFDSSQIIDNLFSFVFDNEDDAVIYRLKWH